MEAGDAAAISLHQLAIRMTQLVTCLFFTDVSTGVSHEHDPAPYPTGTPLARRRSTRSGDLTDVNSFLMETFFSMAVIIDIFHLQVLLFARGHGTHQENKVIRHR